MPTCTISYRVQCKAGLAGSLGRRREAKNKRRGKELSNWRVSFMRGR